MSFRRTCGFSARERLLQAEDRQVNPQIFHHKIDACKSPDRQGIVIKWPLAAGVASADGWLLLAPRRLKQSPERPERKERPWKPKSSGHGVETIGALPVSGKREPPGWPSPRPRPLRGLLGVPRVGAVLGRLRRRDVGDHPIPTRARGAAGLSDVHPHPAEVQVERPFDALRSSTRRSRPSCGRSSCP